jgi:hypothetical protein
MSRDDLILMGRQLNSIKVAQALSALTQIPLTHTLTLRLSAGGCVCAELDIPKEIMLSLSGQAAVTIIQYIRLATDCQILDISRISYHNQSDKNMYIHKVPQRSPISFWYVQKTDPNMQYYFSSVLTYRAWAVAE